MNNRGSWVWDGEKLIERVEPMTWHEAEKIVVAAQKNLTTAERASRALAAEHGRKRWGKDRTAWMFGAGC